VEGRKCQPAQSKPGIAPDIDGMAGDVQARPERGLAAGGKLKRPFNTEARDKAGLPAGFYEGLADEAQIKTGSPDFLTQSLPST
jgi:hypothetical protein